MHKQNVMCENIAATVSWLSCFFTVSVEVFYIKVQIEYLSDFVKFWLGIVAGAFT